MGYKALMVLLTAAILVIPLLMLNAEYEARQSKVVQTALGNAKVYASASHQFRQFYIDEVMPVAKENNIDVVMDVHAQPGALPLAYTAAIDVGLDAYSPEFGGAYFISEFPWRPRAKQSSYELQLWQTLKQTNKPAHLTYERDGQSWLMYAEPIYLVQPFCVECHNSHPNSPQRGWAVGDLRGAEVIKLALADIPSGFVVPDTPVNIIGMIALGVCLVALFGIESTRRARMQVQVTLERQQGERLALISGGVAHHFNNLLTVVLGRAELLEKRFGQQSEVAHILRSVDQGTALVDKLRSAARNQPIQLESVDMVSVVETHLAQVSIAELQVDITLPEKADIFTDPSFADFMVSELINNACEHARTRIDVALVPSREQLRFIVSNDCKAPPNLDMAYVPFFTTQGPGRTGLGLAAVQGMADSLGAEFEISEDQELVTSIICFPVVTTS